MQAKLSYVPGRVAMRIDLTDVGDTLEKAVLEHFLELIKRGSNAEVKVDSCQQTLNISAKELKE